MAECEDRKRARVAEIIGPAGAGKSSVLQSLSGGDSTLEVIRNLKSVRRLRVACGSAASLAAEMLGWGREASSIRPHDFRQAVRFATFCRLAEQSRCAGSRAVMRTVIFDEGPLFLLAWMHAFRAERFKNARFEDWFRSALKRCAGSLDTVIWLDAPDAVLAQRIRMREKPHRMKQAGDREIRAFIERYRASYEFVVASLASHRSLNVIRLNTGHKLLEHSAREALAALHRSAPIDSAQAARIGV